jgi:CHAD domain-containing protein
MTLNFDPAAVHHTARTAFRTSPSPASFSSLHDQPVADAFVVLSAPLASVAFQQAELMTESADAQVLERLRAALRRLRALWWAFAPLLDEKEARIVKKRFKRLAEIAGEPHDIEAACDLLARAHKKSQKTSARLGPVVRTLEEERREASVASCASIRKANVDVLLRRALADARRRLEARTENRTLIEFARERISLADDVLSKNQQRAARMKQADAKTLRRVDDAARKLQCLLELFAPVLERGHRHTAAHLEQAQAALGRLGDVLASEAAVRRVAPALADKQAAERAVRWLGKERRGESRAAIKRLRAIASGA